MERRDRSSREPEHFEPEQLSWEARQPSPDPNTARSRSASEPHSEDNSDKALEFRRKVLRAGAVFTSGVGIGELLNSQKEQSPEEQPSPDLPEPHLEQSSQSKGHNKPEQRDYILSPERRFGSVTISPPLSVDSPLPRRFGRRKRRFKGD
jgi:hypothetical protein